MMRLASGSDLINMLLKHCLEAFFDQNAWNALRWAFGLCNIFLLSERSVDIFWIPGSECVNRGVVHEHLLCHNLGLFILNILPFDSHVTDDWIIEASLVLVSLWSSHNIFVIYFLNTKISSFFKD